MADKTLSSLPAVDALVSSGCADPYRNFFDHSNLVAAARKAIEAVRRRILSNGQAPDSGGTGAGSSLNRDWQAPDSKAGAVSPLEAAETQFVENLRGILDLGMKRVINLSGVCVHTNLGRSVLPPTAVKAVTVAAAGNTDLEFDLPSGRRGDRGDSAEGLLRVLTGAEAACVVNNNAAAVMLLVDSLARGRSVIVSRGELVEIGGAFRIPEVIEKGGARLVEVGTTNRTRIRDYTRMADASTAMFLKVHKSNFSISGFTEEVKMAELASAASSLGIPACEDMGSGAIVDPAEFGLPAESTVAHSLDSGAAVVTFSGDKLLGGPQAGFAVGSRHFIRMMRENPLYRALRPCKLTLAAVHETLKIHLSRERIVAEIPLYRLMAASIASVGAKAEALADHLRNLLSDGFDVEIIDSETEVGSGSVPGTGVATRCVAVKCNDQGPDVVAREFRCLDLPVIGRVSKEMFLLDARLMDSTPSEILPASTLPEWMRRV